MDISKKAIIKYLKASNESLVILCYFVEIRSQKINAKARENYHLNGQTPHTFTSVHTRDVSDICKLGW